MNLRFCSLFVCDVYSEKYLCILKKKVASFNGIPEAKVRENVTKELNNKLKSG